MGTVYLIHFTKPYKHAKHYMGYSDNLPYRLMHHRNGSGANLLKVLKEQGIAWHVVRVWEGDRKLERRLKLNKQGTKYCPVCSGKKHMCDVCGKMYKTKRWLNKHKECKHA